VQKWWLMRQIAEFVAVLACGLFTGAAIYVSLVEHPARMECGVETAMAEFPPSYRRGTVMQATLAVVCLLSSIAAWLAGATFWWAIAGLLLGSVIPFTLIVILSTNKQLLSPTLDNRSEQAGLLLTRWGRLHAVRSILSGLALLLLLYLLLHPADAVAIHGSAVVRSFGAAFLVPHIDGDTGPAQLRFCGLSPRVFLLPS